MLQSFVCVPHGTTLPQMDDWCWLLRSQTTHSAVKQLRFCRHLQAAMSSSSKAIVPDDAAAPMDPQTIKILAVKTLMRERENSRKNSDFTKSDTIRDKLLSEFGVEIFDQKNGPSGWKFKDGSSKKLAAGLTLPVEITATLKRNRTEEAIDRKQAEKKQRVEASVPKSKGGTPHIDIKHIHFLYSICTSSVIKEAALTEEQKRNKLVMSTIMGNSDVLNKQGVLIEEMVIGPSNIIAKSGQRIKVHYVGRLKTNNKMFDSSLKKPFVFRLGRSEVIKVSSQFTVHS